MHGSEGEGMAVMPSFYPTDESTRIYFQAFFFKNPSG